MARARFARRCLDRHLPQSQDTERCSPISCGREEAVQREGYQSFDRSGWLWYGASNGCHRRPIPSRCCQPSDALAERIVAWICEGRHEVDLGRDIESQLFGPFLATLQWRPLSAPLSQIGLVGPSSFDCCTISHLGTRTDFVQTKFYQVAGAKLAVDC
jgi:hypothetical protein